jgi:hypothetical protein
VKIASPGRSEIIDRLIEIALPAGGLVMALYEVYLDESYTRDSEVPPLFVVGGYVMTSDNARLMEKEWREVLDSFGVDHFHMVDVAPCQKDFAHLGMERCDLLARAMIALIKKYVIMGNATIVNPTRRFFLAPDERTTYEGAVEDCVRTLCQTATHHDPDARILFFLEAGHAHQAIANEVINSQVVPLPSYSMHSFAKKKEVCLLQAADLFVWQIAKFVKDRVNKRRKPRKDFRSLVQTVHTWTCIYIFRDLPNYCPMVSTMLDDDSFIDKVFREAFQEDIPSLATRYSFNVLGKTYKSPLRQFWPQPRYMTSDQLIAHLIKTGQLKQSGS